MIRRASAFSTRINKGKGYARLQKSKKMKRAAALNALRQAGSVMNQSVRYGSQHWSSSEMKALDTTLQAATVANLVTITNCVLVSPVNSIGASTGTGLATGWTVLNCLQTGTGMSQRIGNKVAMKSLALSFTLVSAGALSTTEYLTYRYLVVLDKQVNKTAPNISDILQDQGQDLALANTSANTGFNIVNKDRFWIIRDRRGVIDNVMQSTKICSEYIKLNTDVMFSGNATPPTIAQITTNAIYFIVFQDTSANQTAAINILDFHGRLRYNDN
jgi:hypothetical protein